MKKDWYSLDAWNILFCRLCWNKRSIQWKTCWINWVIFWMVKCLLILWVKIFLNWLHLYLRNYNSWVNWNYKKKKKYWMKMNFKLNKKKKWFWQKTLRKWWLRRSQFIIQINNNFLKKILNKTLSYKIDLYYISFIIF